MTAPPIEQADPLAAALERRRRARFTAPAPEVELHTALERLRQQRLERGMVGAEAEAAAAQPVAADVLPARPVPPGVGPETVPYSPLPGLRMELAVPSVPRTIRGVSEPEARQTAVATEQAARDVAAGKARVLLPGGVPASFTERAVGRALARLPGAVGDYGASLTSLGERHQQLEEMGAAETSWLARLPADLGNLALELEAGGRIPGPIGRVIGTPYGEPVLGTRATGELLAPGLGATAGRVARVAGREAGRFGTLEAVKAAGEEAAPGEIAVRGLAGAGGGLLWGAGSQIAREALARAVGAALRPRWEAPPTGAPAAAPPPAPTPSPGSAAAAPLPARVARAPGIVETFAPGEPQRVPGPPPPVEGSLAPAAAAPIITPPPREPELRPPERPGEALHDVAGWPIPGTEVPAMVQHGPPRPEEAGLVTPETAPAVGIVSMRTADITADPARFQFKSLGPEGISTELKGVTRWNPQLAGVIAVWRDPADGKVYVVNGHHRLELAQRLGVHALNVQFVEAKNATEARGEGAYMNIAEGRGTATDVAKFLRDMKVGPETLAQRGVSLRGDLAANGVALSQLAPDVFDQVATQKVPESWGVALGQELGGTPDLQRAALQIARSARTRLNAAEVREIAKQVKAAGAEEVAQETLFGTERAAESLFVPKAQLAAALQKQLATDKRLFGYVSKGARPEELARAGGTQIDVAAARGLAQTSAQAEEVFGRLSTRSGPLAEVLTAGARRIAHGERPSAVAHELYPTVRAAVARELPAGVQPGGETRGAGPVVGRHPAPEGAGAVPPEGEAPGGTRVGEPLQQEDLFGRPRQTAVPVEQGHLPLAPEGPPAEPGKLKTPEEIARVRREGEEPAGERPADLFAQGEQSAVAKAAQQIAQAVTDAVKAAAPPAPPAPPIEPPGRVSEAEPPAEPPLGGPAKRRQAQREEFARRLTYPLTAEQLVEAVQNKGRPLEEIVAAWRAGGYLVSDDLVARARALLADQPPPPGVAEPHRYVDVGTGTAAARAQTAAVTHGSVAQAKRAAVTIVRDANQLNLFTTPPVQALDPAAREAAVARAAEPRVLVPLKGQSVERPEQLHQLLWTFRSPAVERLHFLLLDEQNRILEHQMHSSGALFAVEMPPNFVEDVVAAARRVGAVAVIVAHNHPSGNPEPSRDFDIPFTGMVGRALEAEGLRLRGHYVIDDETGAWLKHEGPSYTVERITVPAPHDALPDWTATQQGAPMAGPEDILALVSNRALPAYRVDVLHLNYQHIAVALEPHSRASLAATERWLRQRGAALAADTAILVAGDEQSYREAVSAANRAWEGVLDVIQITKDPQGHIQARSASEEGLFIPRPGRAKGIPVAPARSLFGPAAEPRAAPAGRGSAAVPPESRAVAGELAPEAQSRQLDTILPPPTGVRESLPEAFGKLLNPAGQGPAAHLAAGIIRGNLGEMARENEKAEAAINAVRQGFPRLDTPQGLDLADRMEAGRPVPPAWQAAATVIRQQLDAARTRVQNLGTGKLQHFIVDYLPHIWRDPVGARSIIDRILGRRPLAGPKSFLKHRTIPTIAQGIQAGLAPATTNLLDMVVLKIREMNRYVMGQRIMQDLKRNGLVKFVRAGQAPPIGYVRIDDAIARVYGPPTKQGAMTIRGEYYAPEPAATLLNNYLRPGLRGNVIYDSYSAVGNLLNQVQLGLSTFHVVFTGIDSMVSQFALGLEQLVAGQVPRGLANIATHWAAPFTGVVRGNHVLKEYFRPGTQGGDFAAIADAVTKGGGRVKMDTFYKNSSVEKFLEAARTGRVGAAAFHMLPATIEFAAKPVLEWWVPRLKLGVFAQLARFELERLPPSPTVEQVQQAMGRAWDSADNRLGQLCYDNLFWNRTLKDLGMASVRALGWNIGSAREIGGGVFDLGRGRFTHRGAYVISLPIVLGLMGAIIMYLFTGHGPESLQDYFEPRDGTKDADGNDNRHVLASYMKDVLAYARHPVQTVEHKLHPLIGFLADMLHNQDYWGDQIRNKHDPLVTQLKQVADYTLKQWTPISVRGTVEAQRREERGVGAVLPFLGITPARREAVRSPAQNLMHDYLQERGTGGATPEQQAERQVRSDLMDRYRRGDLTYGQVREQLHAEGFTADQIATALRQLREPPLLGHFKQLTLEEAEAVYKKGTERERELWGPALYRKRAEAHPRHPSRPQPPRRPVHH